MTSVTYSSTRGGQQHSDFRTVVMTGLAHDGGLFVPDTMPTVTKDELESWRGLSFPDLATNVISKFVKEDQVPSDVLADIVKRSCAAFRSEEVTPVISVAGHKVLVSSANRSVGALLFVEKGTPSFLSEAARLIDGMFAIIIPHPTPPTLAGTLPRTHLCLQGCGAADAGQLF